MKLRVKILSVFLAVLMAINVLPISVFAAREKEYIKEVRISTASTEDDAKQWLIQNGYQVLDVNLNQKSGGDAVYMGYITTTNPDEAITDMAVMQMEGGYSFTEYEAMIEERKEDINDLIDSISTAIQTARDNYKNGYAGAVKACEILNMFVEDDSGKALGDVIFIGDFDKSLVQKIFLQGNSDIITIVYNMLAFACVDIGEDTSWLAKLEDVDIYEEYDPRVYEELAVKMFSSFEEIHNILEYYEKHCREIDENPEIFEGMSDEEIADYYPEDYGSASLVYHTLSQYKYGRGTAAEFFAKDINEIGTEELYPLFVAMTPAERDVAVLVGFEQMIFLAQNDAESLNQYFEDFKEEIEYHDIDGKISVYANVDRSLFDGGVALTNAALRESASTGDTSWYSEDNIDLGLSVTLGCLAGVSLVTSAVVAATSKKINTVVQGAIQTYYKNSITTGLAKVNREMLNSVYAELSAMYGPIETFLPEYQSITKFSELGRYLPEEIFDLNREMLRDADEFVRCAEYEIVDTAVDARVSALNRSMKNIHTVAFVALGLSLLFEAARIGIKLYNQFHPTYTEIPRIIVSENSDDSGTIYINYYVALDDDGEYADLNAWRGNRWNALYTTKDKKAGNPILAAGLAAKIDDSSMPTTDSYGVHYFGETGACDVSRYLFKAKSPETYMFFTRDHSLRATASAFSRGTVITFACIGLLGGLVIGSLATIGAVKIKKKKGNPAEE
jgi:hypothetical protein